MGRKRENFILCIYSIGFLQTNKLYIGSTIRWPYRKREHLYDLLNHKHCNRYLQRAYNKYKLENILINTLEILPREKESEIKIQEKYWIDYFKTNNPKYGYNIIKDPISGKGHTWSQYQRKKQSKRLKGIKGSGLNERGENHFYCKEYFLYSPDGILTKIKNLKYFSETNGLIYNKMQKVVNNQIIEHKGWKKSLDRKNKVIKEYEFIDPTNKYVKIINLTDFCRSKNYSYAGMCGLHKRAQKTYTSPDGIWKKFPYDEKSNKRRGKTYKIKLPSGEEITINNLKLFCKENSISYPTIKRNSYCDNYTLFPACSKPAGSITNR